jgi:hypothetical protein
MHALQNAHSTPYTTQWIETNEIPQEHDHSTLTVQCNKFSLRYKLLRSSPPEDNHRRRRRAVVVPLAGDIALTSAPQINPMYPKNVCLEKLTLSRSMNLQHLRHQHVNDRVQERERARVLGLNYCSQFSYCTGLYPNISNSSKLFRSIFCE